MVAMRTFGGVYLLNPVHIGVNRIGTRHSIHPTSYSRVITFKFGNICADLVAVWTMQCLPNEDGAAKFRCSLSIDSNHSFEQSFVKCTVSGQGVSCLFAVYLFQYRRLDVEEQ
jgi:hypothetical protein